LVVLVVRNTLYNTLFAKSFRTPTAFLIKDIAKSFRTPTTFLIKDMGVHTFLSKTWVSTLFGVHTFPLRDKSYVVAAMLAGLQGHADESVDWVH